jgi:hypothetical protein
VLLVAALQPEPALSLREELSLDDVARAVQVMRQHDPRRSVPGRQRVVSLQERELEVLLGHGAHRWLRAAARVELSVGQARVQFSAHLPAHPVTRFFGRWLNLDLQLRETGGLPALAQLHVGRVPVPAAWAEHAALLLAERSGHAEELRLATEVVQQVRFQPQQMVVRYTWRDDSTRRVLQALLPQAEQQRLRAYSDLLVTLTLQDRQAWELPLTRLLVPAFELARQRTAAGGDAAAENRAALMVLTLYVNGRHVGSVSPAARQWPRPRPMRVLLGGRVDFPQHFLVSAALVLEGSGTLSQAIGLYKEMLDSRGGSGFSFTDMAVNLAGTRFGEALQRDPARLQQRLAAGVQDSDLIPLFADLPEMMPEPQFLSRFGGVGAPAYNALQAEIERRVAALPLLR